MTFWLKFFWRFATQGYRLCRPLLMVFVTEFKHAAGERRWRVQRTIKGQHFNLGWYHSEEEAYAALVRQWPKEKASLTKESLLRKEEDKKNAQLKLAPKRRWEGISFEVDRRCWKVQPSGPRFPENKQREAAQCAARKKNCSLASL